MRTLTAEGRSIIDGVAQRHNVSSDAVLTLLAALDRGNGTQAQFSHFELGGMGQWSRGGMIMVGDMFNNGLKFRVDQLCNELSDLLRTHNLFAPEPAYSAMGGSNWWPASCGIPSSSGSQNDMQYACFPDTRRLAIRRGGHVSVYDTGDHRIGGFSQQQGDGQNLTFSSQYGTVRLFDLGLISGDAPVHQQNESSFSAPSYAPTQTQSQQYQGQQSYAPQAFYPQQQSQPEQPWQPPQPSFSQPEPMQQAPAPTTQEDMFAKIERLHDLHQKGILSEAEFATKKKELLDRL